MAELAARTAASFTRRMLSHAALHRLAPALFTTRPGLPLELPGPPPHRFLSTGGALLPWAADPLGHASRLFDTYGTTVALVRGGGMRHINPDVACPGTVLTYGAEATKLIAGDHETFGKAHLTGALYPGPDATERQKPLLSFGAGLFAVNGDEHKRHRRLLQPAFSRKRLEGYVSSMVRQTEREIASWSVGDERDASVDMRRLASNIVLETLLGGTEHATAEARDALHEVIQLMGRPVTRLLPFDLPTLPFRSYLDAAGRLERGMRAIVEAREGETVETDDMLSALLAARDDESGTRLTQDEILGHVSVFFAAGHETSATSLTWTLLLLSQFPEVLERAQREVDEVLGADEPTPDHLDRLEYLGWIVKESLRLFTPAPWNGRILRRPITLGGVELPVGTEILLSLYETHRREPVFERPLAFRPERWGEIKPSVFEYNPFSAGPRICIGAVFATLEIKVVLALLLRRFRVEVVSQKVDRFAELVLSPKNGLRVVVRPRDFRAQKLAEISGNVRDMVELD